MVSKNSMDVMPPSKTALLCRGKLIRSSSNVNRILDNNFPLTMELSEIEGLRRRSKVLFSRSVVTESAENKGAMKMITASCINMIERKMIFPSVRRTSGSGFKALAEIMVTYRKNVTTVKPTI